MERAHRGRQDAGPLRRVEPASPEFTVDPWRHEPGRACGVDDRGSRDGDAYPTGVGHDPGRPDSVVTSPGLDRAGGDAASVRQVDPMGRPRVPPRDERDIQDRRPQRLGEDFGAGRGSLVDSHRSRMPPAAERRMGARQDRTAMRPIRTRNAALSTRGRPYLADEEVACGSSSPVAAARVGRGSSATCATTGTTSSTSTRVTMAAPSGCAWSPT